MLQMIGSPLADTHMTSEKSLADFDEDARGANQCTLPYEIQREPEQLRAALHYLIAYSNRIIKEEENVRYFTDTVIDCITELVYYGKCGNRVVSYPLILDKLNEIIHQSSLADWMYEFYDYWMEQLAERDIHHKKAYLRSCTYSYLQEYKIKNVYADWMAS